MKRKNIFLFVGAGVLLLFVLFTVGVCTVEVEPIGPMGGTVGFAPLNRAVHAAVGTNETWYAVSEVFGILSLLGMAAFAVLGVYQWIKRGSPRRVDGGVYALALLYVAVMACYVAFELFPVCYRPVLIEGALEPSYPSSHTLLALTVSWSAAWDLAIRIRRRTIAVPAIVLCTLAGGVTVVARVLSGVHWITDVIGAVLLSVALVILYMAVREAFEANRREKDAASADADAVSAGSTEE